MSFKRILYEFETYHNEFRKYWFIYDLPTTLQKCIKTEAYGDTVRFYTGAMPIFKAYGDSSFQDCKKASEDVISVIIIKLQDKVSSNSESIQARAEAVLLLKQLDFPVENLKLKLLEKLEQFLVELDLSKEICTDTADSSESTNGGSQSVSVSPISEQDVANRKIKVIQIDIEDLFDYKDLDEEFVGRVTSITRRYVGIFADAIDELIPEPTKALQDDDHDVLMTQRAEEGSENADGTDPRQKMPPEIKRCTSEHLQRVSHLL